jgi:hypothetical protein
LMASRQILRAILLIDVEFFRIPLSEDFEKINLVRPSVRE